MEMVRFLTESHSDGSILLDRLAGEVITVPVGPVQAAHHISSVVIARDPDEYVEVMVVGTGLAMAGLLTGYGVNVICSHVWTTEADDSVQPL